MNTRAKITGSRLGVLLCLVLGLAACRKSTDSAEDLGLFAGDAAQNAMKKIVGKMPAAPRVFSIEIKPEEMIVIVRSATAPNHLDEFRYVKKGLLSGVIGPKPATPVIINPDLEENLFDLADINLAAVAERARRDREQIPIAMIASAFQPVAV